MLAIPISDVFLSRACWVDAYLAKAIHQRVLAPRRTRSRTRQPIPKNEKIAARGSNLREQNCDEEFLLLRRSAFRVRRSSSCIHRLTFQRSLISKRIARVVG